MRLMPRVALEIVILALIALMGVRVEAVVASRAGVWSSSITISIRRRSINPREEHIVALQSWSWCW